MLHLIATYGSLFCVGYTISNLTCRVVNVLFGHFERASCDERAITSPSCAKALGPDSYPTT